MLQGKSSINRRISAFIWVLLLLGLAGCGGGSANPQSSPTTPPPPPLPPAASFFALNINKLTDPWPTTLGVNFGIWRTLGADLIWSQLEPCQPADETNVSDPCYAWNTNPHFDDFIASATFNGQEVLYTAYYTPTWASQNPSDSCAGLLGAGGCWPPVDVAQGDSHWKNFLAALYQHVSSLPTVGNRQPHIKYWECWNEPNVNGEYAGTMAELNTLCQDLHDTIHALDSTTLFTTPPPTGQIGAAGWMQRWINNGYANEADYIAYHGYVCKGCEAETEVAQIITPLQSLLAETAMTSRPLWDTEVGDGTDNGLPNSDQQAAFVARILLLHQSAGNVFSMAYFGWDFDNIALINSPGSSTATLNAAGVAWQQIYNWTANIGAKYTASPGCSNSSGTIWQCTLSASGTNYLIVWDASQNTFPCPNTQACGSTSFTVPSGYTQYDDLTGQSHTISGGAVQVGAWPIRLH